MKRLGVYCLAIALIFTVAGCAKETAYLPEVKQDHVVGTVGELPPMTEIDKSDWMAYPGNGYHISVAQNGFRYETDFDDGVFEESWETVSTDDAKVCVILYQNSDETKARSMFLQEHDDYIFEDFTGESHCGTEPDGDTLWFRMYQSGDTVYLLSWEYPKSASDDVISALHAIADTFQLTNQS